MPREGGWVQLQQSDMCHVMKMAKTAKGGFSGAARDEMQQ
jgi:hypothetical protein